MEVYVVGHCTPVAVAVVDDGVEVPIGDGGRDVWVSLGEGVVHLN